jgi:hypothetical protein
MAASRAVGEWERDGPKRPAARDRFRKVEERGRRTVICINIQILKK